MIILTEKPSVAADIAHALNFIKDKKNGWFVSLSGTDCIVSAHGHLLELFKPEDYTGENKKKWTLESLPIIPEKMKYKKIPVENGIDSLEIIKKAFQKFGQKNFILATDAEREGELIGALILNYINFKEYDTAKRFWTSEALTKDIILKALNSAKPLSFYESYKKAGFARSHADWLVGINFTRLLSVQSNTLCPFGRVQTAVLFAIYIRDKSIADFITKKYLQLQIVVNKDNTDVTFFYEHNNSNKFELFDKNIKICKDYITNNRNLKIVKIEKEELKENPPQLFDITELQKYCSQNYQLSPTETLDIAQSLYEKYKCLSYPRTPSNVLGDDNVELFREKFDLLKNIYPELAQRCAPEKINIDNKRIFNSEKLVDHHALIPLAPLSNNCTEKEKHVYQAVVKRFFDVIKPPYIFEQITILAVSENNIYSFKATGKKVLQEGWKTNLNEKGPDKEQIIPDFFEEESVIIKDIKVLEKNTKPQPHYTYSSLLAMMKNPKNHDENYSGKLIGLGTPATRAKIVQSLIDRQLIELIKRNIIITEKGKFIIDQIMQLPKLAQLITISTTTKWEEELHNNPDNFLTQIKEFIKLELPLMRLDKKWEKPFISYCPICKGKVYKGKDNFYCINKTTNKCNFSISKKICNATITDQDLILLLQGKQTKAKKMTSKQGKVFKAKLQFSKGALNFVYQN